MAEKWLNKDGVSELTSKVKEYVDNGLASKMTKQSVGSNTKPIYLNNGTAKEIATFPEAYLSWGGKNHLASFGPLDAAMIGKLGANRLAFFNGSLIDAEYTKDGGETWIEVKNADLAKQGLTMSTSNFRINPEFLTYEDINEDARNCMIRITFNTAGASCYTQLNKFMIYCSTNGSTGCWCTIEARLQQNKTNDVDTWVTFANQVTIAGWSGYNIINTSTITTYGNTPKSQYGQIRFTFGCTGINTEAQWNNNKGLNIMSIQGFGGVGWSAPSNMAKDGHLYEYDVNQTMVLPNDLKPKVTNTQNLGSPAYKWANVYATTFNGNLNGNATTATKATQDGDGNVISTTYQKIDDALAMLKKACQYNINDGSEESQSTIYVPVGRKVVIKGSAGAEISWDYEGTDGMETFDDYLDNDGLLAWENTSPAEVTIILPNNYKSMII